ncbi:MAG: hypothetical protein J2P17_25220 [Mycobacterium sp.]|nr:hypothetical protein [Mycobacterium sp.]
MTQPGENFQFKVVYVDPGDGLIVGMEPSGGAVGNKHKVAVLFDPNEYDVLMHTEPAYLSSDKNHVLGAPDHA